MHCSALKLQGVDFILALNDHQFSGDYHLGGVILCLISVLTLAWIPIPYALNWNNINFYITELSYVLVVLYKLSAWAADSVFIYLPTYILTYTNTCCLPTSLFIDLFEWSISVDVQQILRPLCHCLHSCQCQSQARIKEYLIFIFSSSHPFGSIQNSTIIWLLL